MKITTPHNFQIMITDEGKVTIQWYQYFSSMSNLLSKAVSGPVTIPLAKLTGGGANGSLTFIDGVLTNYLAPT